MTAILISNQSQFETITNLIELYIQIKNWNTTEYNGHRSSTDLWLQLPQLGYLLYIRMYSIVALALIRNCKLRCIKCNAE